MNDLRDRYNTLVCYILDNGKKFPKKHGNWVKLNLFKDYFLELDSWNGQISFCRGSGEYNEWLGFNGKNIPGSCLGYDADYSCFESNHPLTLDWLLFDVLKVTKIKRKYT